jgi:acetyl esterase/lipase
LSASNEKRAIVYIHGGGFIMGGGEAAVNSAKSIAGLAQTRTYSIDYRMPPDHPFPAGLDDCVEAYQWVLGKYKPQNIALYGPSAGGNLAAACLLKARDMGLPMPGACVMHSPASDSTESGDTYETNSTIDIVLKHRSGNLFALYANGHDLTDPLISPIFGAYSKGFPPTILTSGTRDLLLSSTVLMHRALRRAGIKAELHVFEAMTHAPFFGSPEEKELLDEHIRFMLEHTGEPLQREAGTVAT